MVNSDFTFRLLLDELAGGSRTPGDLSRSDLEDLVGALLEVHDHVVTTIARNARFTEMVVASSLLRGGMGAIYRCQYPSRGRRVDEAAVREFGTSLNRRFDNIGICISNNGFTPEAELAREDYPQIQLVGPAIIVDWARLLSLENGRFGEAFARRITTIEIDQQFGEIIVPNDDEFPSDEVLISALGIPPAYRSALLQVQHLPLTVLRAVANDPRMMHSLTPRQFEEFTAELVTQLGFRDVLLTPRSADGGYDVIARRVVDEIPITFFFECKNYAESHAVQLHTLRSLLGVVAHRSSEANIGVLVTTSRFTRGSRELIASECRLDGKDYDGIANWVNVWRRRQPAG